MTIRSRTACGVLLLALLAPASAARAAAPPAFAVERLLPGGPGDGARLEAALLLRDLREDRDRAARDRDRLRATPAGAAFLDPASLRRDFGFDWIEDLGRLIELAAPKGRALPAGAALFTADGATGVQVVLDAAPGFTARLEQALRAGTAPPAFRSVAGGLVRGEVLGLPFVGREDEGGAVRFAPTEAALAAVAGGVPVLDGPIAAQLAGCSQAAFVPGSGSLVGKLVSTAGTGAVPSFVEGVTGIALGFAHDGAGTIEGRLVVEHPLLAQLAPALAPPNGAASPFFDLWGDQASAFYALRLPPALLGPGLLALADGLGKAKLPAPPALLEALQGLDGHLAFARFGTPGDWAVGLHFADEAAPAAILPALREWLGAIGEAEQLAILRSLALDSPAGSAAATLTLGPGAGAVRLGATAVGRAVVITPQPARRSAMLAPPAKRGAAPKSPLTAPMRAALAGPSLLAGYQVLGNELDLLGGTGWFALLMREGYRGERRKQGSKLPLADAVMERLPDLAALAAARFDLTYDALLTAGVDGPCAVVRGFSSELPAKGRYFDAVSRRLAGDPAGYYDGLIAIAGGKDAGGREGRRARAALLFNPFESVAGVGVLAAIAVPNFLNFREKAKRAAEAGEAGGEAAPGGDEGGAPGIDQGAPGDEDGGGGAIPDGGDGAPSEIRDEAPVREERL